MHRRLDVLQELRTLMMIWNVDLIVLQINVSQVNRFAVILGHHHWIGFGLFVHIVGGFINLVNTIIIIVEAYDFRFLDNFDGRLSLFYGIDSFVVQKHLLSTQDANVLKSWCLSH